MAIEKFFFIVLIIICFLFYVLYIGDFSLILLIIISALPVYMFVTLLITKFSLSSKLVAYGKNFTKNEPFDVKLTVKNRSIFSCAKAEAVIKYTNLFGYEENEIEIHFPIHARNTQNVIFQLKSKFSGEIKIQTEYITIYDPLKIFKFRVSKKISTGVIVMPSPHEISGVITYGECQNDEGNMYSQFKPGDDPSEVYDLREYVGGDKINRIHWKLSTKKDEFIVKELSLPIDVSATFFLDLNFKEKSEYTLPVFDTLLESLMSLSDFMLENEKPHIIICYNEELNEFENVKITNYDELSALIYRIIVKYSADSAEDKSFGKYIKTKSDFEFSSFTYISSNFSDDDVKMINEEIEAEIKNMIVVTKNVSDLPESNDAGINITEVPIGKISSAINCIEL